jgi:sugar lactone lactonase YvrE
VTRLGAARPGGPEGTARPGGPGGTARPVAGGAGTRARRHDLPPLPSAPSEPGPGGFRPGGYRPGDVPEPDTTGSRHTQPTGVQRLRRWWPAAVAALVVIAVVVYLAVPGGSGGQPSRPAAAAPANPVPTTVPPSPGGQAQLPKNYGGIGVDQVGNIYVTDGDDNQVQKIDLRGNLMPVAGSGTQGAPTGGGSALAAPLNQPKAAIVDGKGNLYIADSGNRVWRVDPHGGIALFAGTGDSFDSGDGGPATRAGIDTSFDPALAVDPTGNLYLGSGPTVRRIDPSGVINAVAGVATDNSSSGDGGPATKARLDRVTGVAADRNGSIYIADAGANRVRKIAADGEITTLAGTGAAGYSGDGGPATAAKLNDPESVAVDAAGNVYIADTNNYRVRRVSPAGVITTICGTGVPGANNPSGLAIYAQLWEPKSLAVDGTGNVYVGDSTRILKIDRSGNVAVVAAGS